MQVESLVFIVILILSVIIHELSHGYAAEFLGDPTPRLQGRLTLNPFAHLDLFGSFIVPLLLILSGTGVIFGWAKPVQYNPYNLKNKKWGASIVAIAGPLSNIFIAVVFAMLLRFSDVLMLSEGVQTIFSSIVLVNIILPIFNLVPIPPLDGHHVLFDLLPQSMNNLKNFLRRNGWFLLIFFIFFLWQFVAPIIYSVYNILVG